MNYSDSGKEFRSAVTYDLQTPDPPHEIDAINTSLEGEKPDGFVKAYLFSLLVFLSSPISFLFLFDRQIGMKGITRPMVQQE